ncbi:MAG: bacteriocin [Thermoanaerobaculia bacterium]|jgi:bacteriocin-like protein
MKPFILKQQEKDFAKVRELRDNELKSVSGGDYKLNTVTVTPNGDGGDDGRDGDLDE